MADKSDLAGALNPQPQIPVGAGPGANPLAGLMALLGPAAAPAAPGQQPPMPMGGPPAGVGGATSPPQGMAPTPQAQGGMNPLIQSLLGQAQGTLNAPMGQPVPQGQGLVNALQHPVVAGILRAIGQAAQSYGWTAMMPQERLERTQLQQQKGEALARLAETGAYQEGMLGIRGEQAATQQYRAETAERRVAELERADKVREGLTQEQRDIQKQALTIRESIAKGKLDEAYAALSEKADDFTRRLTQDRQLAEQSMSIRSTANDIRRNYVDMIGQIRTAAIQQGNARIVAQATEALGKLQTTNWLQDIIGMPGPETAAGAVTGLGQVQQQLPQTGVNPAQPNTTAPAPAPINKGQAKGGGQVIKMIRRPDGTIGPG